MDNRSTARPTRRTTLVCLFMSCYLILSSPRLGMELYCLWLPGMRHKTQVSKMGGRPAFLREPTWDGNRGAEHSTRGRPRLDRSSAASLPLWVLQGGSALLRNTARAKYVTVLCDPKRKIARTVWCAPCAMNPTPAPTSTAASAAQTLRLSDDPRYAYQGNCSLVGNPYLIALRQSCPSISSLRQ